MKRHALLFWAFVLLILTNAAIADTIIFKTGEIIQGTVIQTNGTSVLVKRDYGVFTYPLDKIKDLKKTNGTHSESILNTNRISNWGRIIGKLAKQSWAYGMKQIPATVIDQGVFKSVPYLSFRCGSNYELNIYGDPDNPAAVEMGVSGALLKDTVAKDNCLEFVSSVLNDVLDQEVLKKLKREEDLSTRENLIFEVTPPTSVDAYGGWWISIYDEDKVNAARASAAELEQISEPMTPLDGDTKFNPNDSKWTQSDLKEEQKLITVPTTPTPAKPQFTPAEPISSSTSPYSNRSAPHYSGGSSSRVYVRSYHRKDGTYVHSHSRSSPSRRH